MKRTPRMLNARQSKFGQNPRLKTSKPSSTSSLDLDVALSFLSILKQLAPGLPALDSLPDQTLHSLFHSMTSAQSREAIGLLRSLNDNAGSLFVRCLRIAQSRSSSRMGCMTSPSRLGVTKSKR